MTVLPRSKTNQVSRGIGSHSKDAETRLRDRRVVRDRQPEAEVAARVGGVDDAVVPEARGRVVRAPFALVLREHRIGDLALLFGAQLLAVARELIALHGRQHAGGLLAAHDADPRVRPHPEKARRVRAAAHPVVPGAERAADDHRELRHDRAGHRVHQLRAVLGDAAALVLPADHEAGDVLQEHERDAPLVAQLDEMRRLQRRLGEEHAVVRKDADFVAEDAREAGDDRRGVALLELLEARAVDDARDPLAHVVRPADVARDDAVDLARIEERLLRLDARLRLLLVEPKVLDDVPHDGDRIVVILGEVIRHSADARMHVGAAELLRRHLLARRRFHERRSAEENRAGAFDDHGFVRHRRHVRAARRARAHHRGDLRDLRRRHYRLVVEDAPEVLAVGEDVGLQREERAAGVDEVNARQPVLQRDFLRAEVLLHGHREVRAALDRGVVRDDEAVASGPIPWRCPDFGKIIEPIRRLAADYPGRTLLTRFVDAPQKAGSWVQYYKESAFANVPESDCMDEIVTAPQDLITADNVVTRTTFNKWDGILSKTGPYPHLLLAGVATDCCVLSTALQAAEAGAFVTVALNACAGSSPENQMAAERILRGYKPLIQVTGT